MKNTIEISLYNHGRHETDARVDAALLTEKNLISIETLPRLLPKDRNKKLYRLISDEEMGETFNEEIEDNDYVIAVDLM